MKMTPIHIIGHAGCGKTTLMVELIARLTQKGLHVGTLKHSAHGHELDKPGKDSFLHRNAGAVPCAMMTADMTAIYLPKNQYQSPVDIIEQYFSNTDMVLIEGWISGPYPKIEVWRSSCNRNPLFYDIHNTKAFVTDQKPVLDHIEEAGTRKISCFTRSDLAGIIDYILSIH